MYIITQNVKDLLKNKLNEVINSNVSIIIDNITSIFNGNNNYDKYLTLINTVDINVRNIALEVIKNILEQVDNNFKNSKERKSKYVISKSNIPRTITTIFGDLTFKRTYYQSKFNNSFHFLLDEELGLVKYDRYDQIIKAMAISSTFDTNQKKAGETIGKAITPLSLLIDENQIKNIPRQSVNNWINNWYIPTFEFDARETPNTLFIMVDEKFLGCQDLDNDIMVKAFVSFEGVKNISKGRRKLLNRLVYTTFNKNAWEEYTNWLYKIYDHEKLKNIYLMSDGGNWIKTGINELKMNPNQIIKRLLCEFHFAQSINRMVLSKEEREEIKECFKTKTKNEFIELVDKMADIYPDRKEKINKQKDYVLNNYTAIKDMINFKIGSSMESHISHCVSTLFASRPKGFSSEKIKNYLKINNLYNNNISIYNVYLKTYNSTEETVINNKIINFSHLEKSRNSNIPALNSIYATESLKSALNQIKSFNNI